MIDYTKPAVRLRKTKTIWYKTKRSPTKDGRRVVCPCPLVVSLAVRRSAQQGSARDSARLTYLAPTRASEARRKRDLPLLSAPLCSLMCARPGACFGCSQNRRLYLSLLAPPALSLSLCLSHGRVEYLRREGERRRHGNDETPRNVCGSAAGIK